MKRGGAFTVGPKKTIKKLFLLLCFCTLICLNGTQQASFEVVHAKAFSEGILVVALDDRPVNIDYPLYLAEKGD